MWESSQLSLATFRINGWRLTVRCESSGVTLSASIDDSPACEGKIKLENDALPPVQESFVRGDELHLLLPQTSDTHAGLELVMLVAHADRDCLVLESTIAIETLLLDVSPTVKLQLPCSEPLQIYDVDQCKVFEQAQHARNSETPFLSLLVDQRDQTSLQPDQSSASTVDFFGDFMEKGVIRKTQPWWVWATYDVDIVRLRQLAGRLSTRPLPLTR